MWVDYQLWPGTPALMHAQSIAWSVLVLLAAGCLYRRLLGPTWVAGLAILLTAVDDARAVPVAWIANRNALVASSFALAALWFHHDWRDKERPLSGVLASVCFALALLSAEFGAAAGAYLLAYALFLDRGPWPRRLLSNLPYVTIGILWQAVYMALGFGAEGTGFYFSPSSSPGEFLRSTLVAIPVLLQSQLILLPADLYPFIAVGARPVYLAICLGAILLLVALCRGLLRSDARARFFLVGCVLSLLPVSATMSGDRLLVLAAFGGFGFIALYSQHAWNSARGATLVRRVAWLLVPTLLLLIHLPLSALMMTGRIQSLRASRSSRGIPRVRCATTRALAHQRLVVVNIPGPYYFAMIPASRLEAGLTPPARKLGLATGITTLRLTTLDAQTILVEPTGGILTPQGMLPDREPQPPVSFSYMIQGFESLYRSRNIPFRAGEVIALSDVTITVKQVTEDGLPDSIEFRFRDGLDSPALRWAVYTKHRYDDFQLPPVGGSVIIEATDFSPPEA
jgi:hypothetical protein